MVNFSYPILGMIREDRELSKVIRKFQIPTTDELFHTMKSAKDFQAISEMLIQVASDPSALRTVSEEQHKYTEDRIYTT